MAVRIFTLIIKGQIDAIFTDIEVSAVKIGMVSQSLPSTPLPDKLEQYQPKNVVLDPVMISKSGFDLMQPEAKEALITRLIPLAYVITPNLPEAEVITGRDERSGFYGTGSKSHS